MATVYVKTISAFDAANAQIISFGYSGNQCTKNRITVYNSSTSAVVFDDITSTYSLTHTIPFGTLANGTSYYCTITAYYSIGEIEYSVTSSASNIWMCLATATWGISGVSNGSIIGNSYIDLSMEYAQANGDIVNEYYINLYTQSGSIYWTSGILYNINFTTSVTGLPNNTVFYIRAYGTTVNGLNLDTGNIEITTDYTVPSIYSVAYLENDKWHGWTKITTNVADVEGIGSGSYSFINDEYVDLSSSGSSVLFSDNFNLSGNFVAEFLGKGMEQNDEILNLSGDSISISITVRTGNLGTGELYFVELREHYSDYVLYSNTIEIPSNSSFIHIWVQRKDGLYNCIISNEGEV